MENISLYTFKNTKGEIVIRNLFDTKKEAVAFAKGANVYDWVKDGSLIIAKLY